MSLLSKRIKHRTHEGAIINAAANDVTAIIGTHGGFQQSSLTRELIAYESIGAENREDLKQTLGEIVNVLSGSESLRALISARIPSSASDEERANLMEIGFESAAYTIASGNDAESVFNSFKLQAEPSGNAIMVMPTDGDVGTNYNFESFDVNSFQKFIPATTVVNAQAAIAGGFSAVFFPNQLVPTGQSAVQVQITIPKIATNQLRGINGAKFDLVKTSIIKGVANPSIFESEATTIIPYAVDAVTPASLVTNAVIPTFTKNVLNVPVNTRPILFNTEVELISLSDYPGLVTAGALDITDSLDSVVNIGVIYIESVLTIGSGSPLRIVFPFDVSNQVGSLLTQVPAGKTQEYQTTIKASVTLSSNTTAQVGAKSTYDTALLSVLGLTGGYTQQFYVEMSANLNIETAAYKVNFNGLTLGNLYDSTGALVVNNPLASLPNTTTFTLTPLGSIPIARRTNSNLRSMGTIIDSNTTETFLFPVNLQPPFVAQAPVGTSPTTSFEGCAEAMKLRNDGRCVTAFANHEIWLAANANVPSTTRTLGLTVCKPTYVSTTLPVADYITTLNSMHNLDNLRGQMLAVLTVMVNNLFIKSDYLAALEYLTGDINAFEIIIAGDPQLVGYLWESGDIRTFGDNRKYTITTSLNDFFTGKIYVSFRRSGGSDEIHPLDFGRSLISPAMTYTVAVNRNGQIHNETQLIPRFNAYCTLPVLGVLNVTGLADLYAIWGAPANPSI